MEQLKKNPSLQDIYDYLTQAKKPIADTVLIGYYTMILWMITDMQAKKTTHTQTSINTTKKISTSAKRAQEKDIWEAESMINNM